MLPYSLGSGLLWRSHENYSLLINFCLSRNTVDIHAQYFFLPPIYYSSLPPPSCSHIMVPTTNGSQKWSFAQAAQSEKETPAQDGVHWQWQPTQCQQQISKSSS